MFDVPVKDCVAVVVDPTHERFGQVADIEAHDWSEYGNFYLKLSDGQTMVATDDLMMDEVTPPMAIAFLRAEEEVVLQVVARLPELRADLREFMSKTEDPELSFGERKAAKAEFNRLVRGLGATQARLF